MENILKESKEKIKQIALNEEDMAKYLEDTYKEEKNDYFKIMKVGGLFSIVFALILFFSKYIYRINGDVGVIVIILGLIFLLASISGFLAVLLGLAFLKLTKNSQKIKEEDKLNKLMNTPLSEKELEQFKPLINKMESDLTETQLVEFIKIVEFMSECEFNNAYFIYYLIDNYEDLIKEVKNIDLNNLILKDRILSINNKKFQPSINNT